MKAKTTILYLILTTCLISFNGNAQFTYFDGGLSQSNLTLNADRKTSVKQVTALNTTQFHLGGLWRFNKYFGIGLDVGVPIIQKSKYTLKFSEAGSPYSSNYNNYFTNTTEARYQPQKFDYTFKQSIQFGIVGRVFVGGATNLFLDLRISSLKLKERFVFIRVAHEEINAYYNVDYRPALAAENIHENHQQFLIIPGIAIGWQPHLNDRFFMNFNLAYDFYLLKDESFSHWVPYLYRASSQVSTSYHVRLASQLTANKLAVSGTLRFGMFF